MAENRKLKSIIRYVLSAAVAVVLMYFSFREVKWGDFVAGLRSCRWGWIVLSMSAGIMAFYLRGLRWRELLLPLDGSIGRVTAFNAINIGYLANFIFPRIGEFVRCGVITNNSLPQQASDADGSDGHSVIVRKKASYDKVIGTVVLERSWDMVTMLLFLVALLVFKWDEFGGFFVDEMWHPMQQNLDFSLWWIVAGIVVSIAVLIWVIVATRTKFRFSEKICSLFGGVMLGLGSCMKMKRKWVFFVYTALIWLMYWTMSAATMTALPDLEGLGPVDALFLMVAGSFGWLVPVPGGFGAFHFIVSLALSTIYGIPFEMGIVFATLSHESQAITMAVCGGISYVCESFRK